MSIIRLDIPAIEKMPGGEVMRLVRDALNLEAARLETLEESLVKNGMADGPSLERLALVRALAAASDAITFVLVAGESKGNVASLAARRSMAKDIADQMRAALIAPSEEAPS